ncbi:hypothetical protein K1T71_009475 [Dendrolimus kikuchii]|uniref:Uncharacterized protein n=1 Tax=Dendrolimus kikuchii TaxID=765133 RepID=A0ACC1CUH3_9NEOP|nr:hypothetical protein K1T71_009475 [Dendrolimus kikuchii]
MVKRDIKTSISEDEVDNGLVNENGKRPNDAKNKEGKKRLKTKSLYRQPTVNELNRLQETENLFNSNLFRLQVEEILAEVKVKEKTEKKFNQWFTEFKTYLLTIPEDKNEYDLSEQTLPKKLKVKLPITNSLNKTKCVFKFHKFHDVNIVGSYALECSINSKLRIDLQIVTPADTYTKNDSINYRYHKKRAAYLAVISSHLMKTDLVEDLHYSWTNGNKTTPVLDLEPSGKLKNYFSIRLNLVCDQETFKLHRFSPLRNNLREAWLFSIENVESTEVGPPTPYYNSVVLNDLIALANQELLKEFLLKSENLKQAIILLKIWLRQRNLKVSGFVISLIVLYYVKTKRINNIMSSYQIVRNVWIALSKCYKWEKKGISLNKTDDSNIQEFHNHFPVVFLDCTGQHNLCWEMCIGTYDALRRESALAVEMLDNGKINSFIPLFMTPVKVFTQFDHVYRGLPRLLHSSTFALSFWGDKSELRRFQDGSITETVVWKGETLAERRTVTKQIIDYLMNLKFGHSGKWPGDIEAFRCLKAAFNLQIAERLNQQYSLPTQPYKTHIDVLKNGLTFRLKIAHPKELTLLRREIENGVVKYKESEESVRLQCDTILMPRLRGALHGLQTKYPAYGPTVCLLKRWLSSHLLSPPHFPQSVAELLAAAVFVHPAPSHPPALPSIGLVRVLNLLAHTDWNKEIIFLDFNEDMSREEITKLEQKFNSGDIPSPCLRIVTAYDDAMPSVWSMDAPSLQVLARVQTLARSALNYIEEGLLRDFKENVLGLFVPSLSGYDVVIHLQPSLVPYVGERVDKVPELRRLPERPAEDVIPVVEFHPILKYLEELRAAYSEFALFFHDFYGGEVIAVLWKPDFNELRDFQLLNANALKPITVEEEIKYKVNTEAIVEDFRVIGQGLVKEITVNT